MAANPSDESQTATNYASDVSIWCENGHDPKIPDKVDGTFVCRHCGREYEVDLIVEVR